MKLVTSKTIKLPQLNKILKGIKITLEGDNYKPLSSGKKLYLYVEDDGSLASIAGLFAKDPTASIYKNDEEIFKDQANFTYTVTSIPETLKGSRIAPTFLEITKVDLNDLGATVTGFLHNARDPRLPYLDRSEKNEHGTGEFKLDDMIALYDGSFFHLVLSPEAEEIEKVVNEQRTLFQQYSIDNDEDTKKALSDTYRLLKPFAYEIFKIDDDLASFVTKTGKWQTINLAGNRKLDAWDRERIYKFAEDRGLLDEQDLLKEAKESFYKKPMQERFDLEDLTPILLDEVLSLREKDQAAIEEMVTSSSSKKPTDGLDPIPGLNAGVEFIPHQSYIISKIRDRDRQLIDADPGAGKTAVIIADVLHQIAKDRIKRPIAIMPNNLVSQFAQEVRNFSSLNPWIITTETIKSWGKGYTDDKFSKILDSAKSAPVNTLFITSYHFLAAAKKLVDNGQITEDKGRQVYKQTKTFPNAYRILNELGIDYVAMDECHTLKNDSNFTKAVSVFSKVSQVKGFTGTIMPGNLIDVLGPMGIIHSSVLGSAQNFVQKFSPTKSINSYHDTAPKDIRAVLQRFGTPQVRATAWGSMMPKVHREYHYVSFNTTQQKFYEAFLKNKIEDIKKDPALLKHFNKFNLNLEDEDVVMNPALRAKFTPLDVFLNSPGEAEKYLGASLTGDDAMSPKIQEINSICSKHLSSASNGKILIFVQYKEAGKNLLRNLDPNLKNQAAYYEGGMVEVLNRFKIPDSNLKILIGVDSTLRMGHNLQVANCVIHADTLWLNGDVRQREARANRLKQKREVYIHHVIVHNSHELLKNARLLSQAHTIAKANSDFKDDTMLPHVEMTLDAMSTYRSIDKIEPLMARQKKIEDFSEKQTKVEKEFFGTHTLLPQAYEELSVGKKLAIVPSTENFEGNRNDATYLIEEELETMKWETTAPTLSFNLQNWDDTWFLTMFKSADPNGFARRLGFMLQPQYFYKEVSSKGGVSGIIESLEDGGIEIINKDSLQSGVAKARLLHPSRMGTLKRLEQESKTSVAGKAATTYQVEFFFSSIDGYPFVMSDNVKFGSKEGQILKKKGFKEGEPFWYLPTRRSALVAFFKKLETNYPGIKIARWEEFKTVVRGIFGSDLKDFDEMGK